MRKVITEEVVQSVLDVLIQARCSLSSPDLMRRLRPRPSYPNVIRALNALNDRELIVKLGCKRERRYCLADSDWTPRAAQILLDEKRSPTFGRTKRLQEIVAEVSAGDVEEMLGRIVEEEIEKAKEKEQEKTQEVPVALSTRTIRGVEFEVTWSGRGSLPGFGDRPSMNSSLVRPSTLGTSSGVVGRRNR